jgi:iron complex outermembrane receptor protein
MSEQSLSIQDLSVIYKTDLETVYAVNHISLDLNAGSLPNQALVVKRTGFTAPNSARQWYSDYFVENASFFRLDDVNLGYTFRGIGRWETDIRLALGVQNVFVITGYSGGDPEVISENGIDGTTWPRSRTYSLRLNVNF